jgi:hypothetical protein
LGRGAYEAEEVHEGQDRDDVPVDLAPHLALFFNGPCVGFEVVKPLQVMNLSRFVHFYVRHVDL